MSSVNLMTVQCPDKRILTELLSRGDIQSAFFACSNHFGKSGFDDRVYEFDWNIGLQNRYDKIIDLEKLPSLNKELLESFREFEGMAIKLGGRKTNFEIADYDSERRNLLNHLRFWNYIIKEYRINAVYFVYRPHHQMEYIIYALCKIYKIPMLISMHCSIPGVHLYGDDVDTIGKPIGNIYRKSIENREENELPTPIKMYWESITRANSEIKKELKKTSFEQKKYRELRKIFFGKYIGLTGVKYMSNIIVKYMMGKIWRNSFHISVDKKDYLVEKEQRKRIRYYIRNNAMTLKEYNRRAVEPDYSKDYVYFALQLTPEETTIPAAGVFAEQYTSLAILSQAAQKAGVMVYVKEHYVQTFRTREVYEMMFHMPNVKMIKSSVNSLDLMQNALAVSTQTGTCILEGAVRGKPALVFSSGYNWKDFPNLYEIKNEEQGARIIEDILSGRIKPTELSDVRKYFAAIGKRSIVIPQNVLQKSDESIFVSKSRVELLSRWIQKNFSIDEIGEIIV